VAEQGAMYGDERARGTRSSERQVAGGELSMRVGFARVVMLCGVFLVVVSAGCGEKVESPAESAAAVQEAEGAAEDVEAPAEPEVRLPSFYVGKWSGESSGGYRVVGVEIEEGGNGSVNAQVGSQVFKYAVVWEEREGALFGTFGEGEHQSEAARVHLDRGKLSGYLVSPLQVGDYPKELTFSGFERED